MVRGFLFPRLRKGFVSEPLLRRSPHEPAKATRVWIDPRGTVPRHGQPDPRPGTEAIQSCARATARDRVRAAPSRGRPARTDTRAAHEDPGGPHGLRGQIPGPAD